MIISKDITKKILNYSVVDLDAASLNIVTYSYVAASSTKAITMTLTVGSTVKSIYKKGDACVYAIYEIGTSKVLKYIGSSLDINNRLKEHLVKNESALADGTFIKNSSGIIKHSQLANVYQLMNISPIKQIGFKVISIDPKEYYNAVESVLIKHYNLKRVGWNKMR